MLYGLVHLLYTACLPGGFHRTLYALAPSTDTIYYFVAAAGNIPSFMFPLSPAALAFRRAAARCGFASTVVVPCIRPGTVRGLGCGVDAANILPGRAPPAWRGSSRL